MSTARPLPACGQGLTDTQLLFHIIQNYTVIISACSLLSIIFLTIDVIRDIFIIVKQKHEPVTVVRLI